MRSMVEGARDPNAPSVGCAATSPQAAGEDRRCHERTAFELDHVGVGARDLAPLAAAYERLGFTLTPVARHRGKATGNRCVMLQHGYLELIALIDPSIPDNGCHAQLERYAGLHIIALGIHDFGRDARPTEAGRVRHCGCRHRSSARWTMPTQAGAQARFERIPAARCAGRDHPADQAPHRGIRSGSPASPAHANQRGIAGGCRARGAGPGRDGGAAVSRLAGRAGRTGFGGRLSRW